MAGGVIFVLMMGLFFDIVSPFNLTKSNLININD